VWAVLDYSKLGRSPKRSLKDNLWGLLKQDAAGQMPFHSVNSRTVNWWLLHLPLSSRPFMAMHSVLS